MTTLAASPAPLLQDADRRESRFRIAAATVVTLFWYILFLGTAWDIQWHSDVGPDSFWTPPHTAMYSGVAVAGLVSLLVVIRTTILFNRRSPGVSDATTTPWLGFLRAPVGFIVSGLGVASFLLYGAFDELWHSMYGFDVTIWSPPHIGLITSALVGMTGIAYAMGSEVTRSVKRGETGLLKPAPLGFLVAVAGFISFSGILLAPTLIEAPLLGPFTYYPVMASALFGVGFGMALGLLRTPGTATLLALMVTAMRWVAGTLSPVLVNWLATSEGLPVKYDAVGKTLPVLAIPVLLVVAGLAIDLAYMAIKGLKASPTIAVAVASATGLGLLWLVEKPWYDAMDFLPWITMFPETQAQLLSGFNHTLVLSLLFAPLVAALFAWGGSRIGSILRLTYR